MESWRGNQRHGAQHRDRKRRPAEADRDRDYGRDGGDRGDNRENKFDGPRGPSQHAEPHTWGRSRESQEPRRAGDRYGPPPGLGQGGGHSQGGAPRWPPPPPSPRLDDNPPPPRRGNYYPPPPPDRYDTYRPPGDARPPQGDFSFRMDKPAGVGDSRDTSHSQLRYRGGRGGQNFRKKLAADRPMLSFTQTTTTTEITLGVDGTRSKFRAVEDLSDDAEVDMEMSDDSKTQDRKGGRAKKKARVEATPQPADNVPKWSNPDPYSVLPPTESGSRKTTTILDLIQKARIESDQKKVTTTVAEDFISFDDDGPKKKEPVNRRKSRSRSRSRERDGLPVPSRDSGPLGSRKRTIDDELKPPSYLKPKGKALREAAFGQITSEWAATPDEEDCPWNTKECPGKKDPNVWLHQEIFDFYNHVKPRTFEHKIRGQLLSNLRRIIKRDSMFRDASVQAFGSYASDLYLPTADMDLVVCSRSFSDGSLPVMVGSRWLHRFRALLTRNNVAQAGTIELILHAKVPIVKYIDRESGLRVDISFENLTGVDAIETFMDWKTKYPAMPILVTLVKHFLGMRGLNEPVNGGIGGFTVICLVVSMFQMMPQVQSRSLQADHHLGEMLMEFFRLYGMSFNYATVAIRLNPPNYTLKANMTQVVYKGNNQNRLSVIDPNNPANDISGGSSNFPAVQKCFEEAYNLLKKTMASGGISKDNGPRSLLRCILSGNYSTFRRQRNYLRMLNEKRYSPTRD